ncbi:MAG: DUF2851 family protein [Gelidibacter sp.]
MQEDFLHYIWKYKKLNASQLKTTTDEALTLVNVGQHNQNAGPDFFNAQLKIGKQLWAGNVEVHIKSSDWYLHNHETDSAYDNVILHVVYEHDTDIFRKDNTTIPTLQLKNYINKDLLNSYYNLFSNRHQWINCENEFPSIKAFTLNNWLESLYIERLERKTKTIETLLQTSKNNWEAVLFKLLAKNFGLKVNGDAFWSLANSFDFTIIRKLQSNPLQLEALLFGQADLLSADVEDTYVVQLTKEYQFIKQKFNLQNEHIVPMSFFRLRPPNFPTIRLSQLAMLYHHQPNLFSKMITANTIEELYLLFDSNTSTYWNTHYTFGKVSKTSNKTLTKSFIDLLLINTILPLKFCYLKSQGKMESEVILNIAQHITSEKNSIVNTFNSLKQVSKSALQSQALLQLKTEYCDKNRCLHCAIGNTLITNQQITHDKL